MAMTASGMATKIVDKLKVVNTDIAGSIETELVSYWTEICQGILDEFSANAEVDPGSFLDGNTNAVTGTGGPIN